MRPAAPTPSPQPVRTAGRRSRRCYSPRSDVDVPGRSEASPRLDDCARSTVLVLLTRLSLAGGLRETGRLGAYVRVLVTSTCGSGHIYPMVPLARAFDRAGHDLVWATAASSVPLVEGLGFRGAAAGI